MALKKAYFAAGCFWGVEHLFKKVSGVVDTIVGYCGGTKQNPTYEDVLKGNTGHLETVEVVYDDNKVSYPDLVKIFLKSMIFHKTTGKVRI